MIGVIVLMTCASLICTLFINYNIDLGGISNKIIPGPMQELYDAQIMSGKVLVCTAGGCLIITTFVMLLFYIKFYIDGHKSELGIFKALGYSNMRISKDFYKFGLSVFAGTLLGYIVAHLMMGYYYEVQLEDGLLPTFEPSFNFPLLVFVVFAPTIFFSIVSIIYAYFKLKQPALDLIKGKIVYKTKGHSKNNDLTFLQEMKKNTVRSRKSLAFFVGFSAFCFAAMIQMSSNVHKIASPLMGWMVFGIGVTLSVVIMFLAISTLMHNQKRNIGLMRIFGYQMSVCKKYILGCFRPIVIIGFIIGTVYQYGLLKVVVDIVFKDLEVPELEFNVPIMLGTIAAFVILYEGLLLYFSRRIKKLPIKEIMLESN